MTKKKNKHKYPPIVIPKATIDRLKKHGGKDYCRLLALYADYYYTAVWQKTNRPKASVGYMAKSLGLGTCNIRRLGNILEELGLIKDIVKRRKGVIIGHYVEIVFYAGQKDKALDQKCPTPLVATGTTNAYSNNKLNAYSNNIHAPGGACNTLLGDVITWEGQLAERLKQHQEKVNIGRKRNTAQYCKRLIDLFHNHHIPKERINTVYEWYIKNYDDEYTPKLEKLDHIIERFSRIERAMQRKERSSSKMIREQPSKDIAVWISKEAKEIVLNLLDLGNWDFTEQDLQIAVQTSLNNYQHHIDLQNKLYKQLKKKGEKVRQTKRRNGVQLESLYMFVQNMMEDANFDGYIERWFGEYVYEKLKSWQKYDGDLTHFIWNNTNRRWHKKMIRYVNDFGESTKFWYKYLEVLERLDK